MANRNKFEVIGTVIYQKSLRDCRWSKRYHMVISRFRPPTQRVVSRLETFTIPLERLCAWDQISSCFEYLLVPSTGKVALEESKTVV